MSDERPARDVKVYMLTDELVVYAKSGEGHDVAAQHANTTGDELVMEEGHLERGNTAVRGRKVRQIWY